MIVDQQYATAVRALQETTFDMRNIARTSFVDVGDPHYRSLAVDSRKAIRPLLGHRIIGGMLGERFYDLRPKEKPVRQPQRLERLRYQAHDFKGILTGLVNIEVPSLLGDNSFRRLCLQIAPLDRRPDPTWTEYYQARGWQDSLVHPFAVAELAGRTAWVPVDSIKEHTLHFPEGPEDSVVIRRVL